jgi:hypothetical protein
MEEATNGIIYIIKIKIATLEEEDLQIQIQIITIQIIMVGKTLINLYQVGIQTAISGGQTIIGVRIKIITG